MYLSLVHQIALVPCNGQHNILWSQSIQLLDPVLKDFKGALVCDVVHHYGSCSVAVVHGEKGSILEGGGGKEGGGGGRGKGGELDERGKEGGGREEGEETEGGIERKVEGREEKDTIG